MKVIIDRFEGGFAVVELPDKTMANLPLALVPNAKEGDVVSIEIDARETDEVKARVEQLMKEVWND
ncbi:MAG: DUF3006 domain-containing protein [Clostridiales bacterium]|jgi:hypothetical protein|nr:DUF3006 domain-containing protein [Clostridiales bacterium]